MPGAFGSAPAATSASTMPAVSSGFTRGLEQEVAASSRGDCGRLVLAFGSTPRAISARTEARSPFMMAVG